MIISVAMMLSSTIKIKSTSVELTKLRHNRHYFMRRRVWYCFN